MLTYRQGPVRFTYLKNSTDTHAPLSVRLGGAFLCAGTAGFPRRFPAFGKQPIGFCERRMSVPSFIQRIFQANINIYARPADAWFLSRSQTLARDLQAFTRRPEAYKRLV